MPPNKQEDTGPVMDIQKPLTVATPPKDPTVISPSGPLGRPATMEYTRPRPQDPNTPKFTPAPEERMKESPFKAPDKKKKSHKGLWISLIILLVVGVGGAGAYYYFMVMNNESPATTTTTQQETATQEEASTVQATPEGVDQTTEAIDKSLSGLDDADYNQSQVSDDSLGL